MSDQRSTRTRGHASGHAGAAQETRGREMYVHGIDLSTKVLRGATKLYVSFRGCDTDAHAHAITRIGGHACGVQLAAVAVFDVVGDGMTRRRCLERAAAALRCIPWRSTGGTVRGRDIVADRP